MLADLVAAVPWWVWIGLLLAVLSALIFGLGLGRMAAAPYPGPPDREQHGERG